MFYATDRTADAPGKTKAGRMTRQRLDTKQAAQALGISMDAVRKRASRGLVESEKGQDGKLYIWLDTDTPEQDSDPKNRLIEVLQEQLEHEREVNRENRRIIAGLVQRIPAIEAPQEPSESPETSSDNSGRVERGTPDKEQPVSWWRRLFGG
jgi:hypothetical protein